MSNIELVKILPATVQQQTDLTKKFIDLALSGEVNPLELDLYLKALENVVDRVRKDYRYKDAVQDEIGKFPEKKFVVGCATIEKSGKTTYDYSTDETWKDLDGKRKDREKILKNLQEELVNPETGEVATPPIRKHSEYIKVTFNE